MYEENKKFPDIMSEISIAISDIFGQIDLVRYSVETQLYTLLDLNSFAESVNSGKSLKNMVKSDLVEFIKKLFKALDAILGLVSVGNNQSKGEFLFLIFGFFYCSFHQKKIFILSFVLFNILF